jgi:hypothetical protein
MPAKQFSCGPERPGGREGGVAWLFGALISFGALSGLWLRAPAMLAATAGVVLAVGVLTATEGLGWRGILAMIVLSVIAFQTGYIAGLAANVLRRRRQTRRTGPDRVRRPG